MAQCTVCVVYWVSLLEPRARYRLCSKLWKMSHINHTPSPQWECMLTLLKMHENSWWARLKKKISESHPGPPSGFWTTPGVIPLAVPVHSITSTIGGTQFCFGTLRHAFFCSHYHSSAHELTVVPGRNSIKACYHLSIVALLHLSLYFFPSRMP